LIGSKEVAAVIEHPLMRAVTLTGSGSAGREVASRRCDAERRRSSSWRSDPYLVLEDADLEQGGVYAQGDVCEHGQSCSRPNDSLSWTRSGRGSRSCRRALSAAKFGDPLSDQRGSAAARHDLRDALHDQCQRIVAMGARCLAGRQIPTVAVQYYPPTVLPISRRACPRREELFGPVRGRDPCEGREAAIAVANDSVFGLGGAVLTRDRERGERIAANASRAVPSLSMKSCDPMSGSRSVA